MWIWMRVAYLPRTIPTIIDCLIYEIITDSQTDRQRSGSVMLAFPSVVGNAFQ